MRNLALLLLGALGFACTPTSRALPIVGPDGSRMVHLSCTNDEGRCYQLAGEHCPYGYDMSKTSTDGNFLLRCRPYQPGAAATWQPPSLVIDPYAAPQLAPSPYGSASGPPAPSPYPPLGGGTAGSAPRGSGDIGY